MVRKRCFLRVAAKIGDVEVIKISSRNLLVWVATQEQRSQNITLQL